VGENHDVREDIDDDDFHEEDEPIADILAILERPPDGVTMPPWLRGVAVAPGVWALSTNYVDTEVA
jgi:hypothetical protein